MKNLIFFYVFFFSIPSNVYAYGIPKEENTWKPRNQKSTKESSMINYLYIIQLGLGYCYFL